MHDRSQSNSFSLPALIRLLRPVQWSKNLLLFAPLVLSHQADRAALLGKVGIAFACFCACASAIYIINDWKDIEHDRAHPTKRNRPLASGAIALSAALPFAAILLALGLAASYYLLPRNFLWMLLIYIALSISYSMFLKSRLLVDVMVLAGLYTMRLLAGGAAVGVRVSEWLLAFSTFLFVSLAFAKRYSELHNLRERNEATVRGRGYMLVDLEIIQSVGPASAYMAVLVFALYIYNSVESRALYNRPFALWLLCPLLMYWLTRLWFLTRRGVLKEDPVLFALKDKISWIAALTAVILVIIATYKPA